MNEDKSSKVQYISWQEFASACLIRFTTFVSHPILFFYFVIVVLTVGSAGVWIPFISENTKDCCFNADNTLSIGLATYCIALLAAAMADNLLSPEKLKTVRFFIFCLFLLSFLLAVVTIILKNVYVGCSATFLTSFIWILNYSEDEAKKDEVPPPHDSGTGGSTDKELPGSIEGFKS